MRVGEVGGLKNNDCLELYMENREIMKTRIDPHILRISLLFAVCSLIYYIPTLTNLGGNALSTPNMLDNLHDFYGLDFYALIFFIPVVYAAYSGGVTAAVTTALLSMIIFIPYSVLMTDQAGALFRPTAFVIILSAVGAVVAMLQGNDKERKRSLNELECLYDIGKATERCRSTETFLTNIVNIIYTQLKQYGCSGVIVTSRGQEFIGGSFIRNHTSSHSGQFSSTGKNSMACEDIVVNGEKVGMIRVFGNSAYLRSSKSSHFVKTLAERTGGAVYAIELEQSLKIYYAKLEEMVEKRTHDLEQAQEKLVRSERLAAVGELASGVGHELRNPLNVIRNCVYLINMSLNENTSPEVEENLKLLDLQVDISNKIVTDLLDFTRVKAPVRTDVDLNRMLIERVSWAAVPEKVGIKYEFATDSPHVNVDSEQIGRAFTNIIINAVQSINTQGELRISTGAEGDRGWVIFTDNGCGIPPQNINKIFEPLFTTKPKGTGMGMAISKRMVEQNSGEIEVESTLGKGTSFKIKLPLVKTN
jgi:signal transduction histidine kinase